MIYFIKKEAVMAKFIDFIVDSSQKPDLAKDLIEKIGSMKTSDDVAKWFKDKGYDLDPDEAEKIFKSKNEIKEAKDITVKASY